MPKRSVKLKRSRSIYNATNDGFDDSAPSARSIKQTALTELEYCMSCVSTNVLHRLPHYMFPAFNIAQHPTNDFSELRCYPSCEISMPYPVYIAPHSYERIDICHRRTTARNLHNRRLNNYRSRYHMAHTKNRKLQNMEDNNIYPVALYNFAEQLESNPDPFFHGSYDYYYTGGNLCVLPDAHVVHVDGPNLSNLHVGILNEADDSNISLHALCSASSATDEELFEIRHIQSLRDDLPTCFAVRERNSITLRSLQANSVVKAITQFKTKSVPFISFAQSLSKKSTFVISTINQKVRLYDLNSSAPVLCETFDMSTNEEERISWNTIRPWCEQAFIYANEHQVHIMDMRCTPDTWLQSACTQSPRELGCDVISQLALSEMRNLLYVATNHKLHCLDLRYLGKTFETANAICCWMHQMEQAPTFIDTYRVAGSEYIAMSSALADDWRICELTREHHPTEASTKTSNKSVYKSYALPYQPPTLEEAYQKARLAGKCLQTDAALSLRINRCTTGISFCDSWKKINNNDETLAMLLFSNSMGDVFGAKVTERKTQNSERPCDTLEDEIMNKYAETLCALPQEPLNHTSVVDLKAIRKVFLCDTLSMPAEMDHKEDLKLPRRFALGRWQKSIPVLHSFKDALVKNILSIWDIDYEDNKDIGLKQIEKTLDAKPDPKNLVSSWLNDSVNQAVTQPPTNQPLNRSTVMSATLATESDTFAWDETIKLEDFSAHIGTQQQSTQFLDHTNDISYQLEEEFISINSKPKSAKKKKYVKGF